MPNEYESFEINGVNGNLFFTSLFIAAFTLTSCSGESSRPLSQNSANTPPIPLTNQRNDLPIAESKGLNAQVMDGYVTSLINETAQIEAQVEKLMQRLTSIRMELAAYQPNSNTADTQSTSLIENYSSGKPLKELDTPVVSNTKAKTLVKKADKPTVQSQNKPRPPVVKSNGVLNVRTGVHSNKTRLVFDVNGPLNHNFDYDKEVGLLTVTLPETKWSTTTEKTYNLKQIKGYEAKPQGQGTVIAMIVTNTQSVKTSTIQKTGGKPARLVIDLVQ